MSADDWQNLTSQELRMAENARRRGNEGRARVCARRAAGHVIGEYLARNNISLRTGSALERLRYLYSSPDINQQQRETIEHFLVHTTPEGKLPIEVDLIEEVNLLASQLLGESLV